MTAHVECRKNYIRPQSIVAAVMALNQDSVASDERKKVQLRSSIAPFDFKSKCFFCAEIIGEDFHQKEQKKPLARRRSVHNVRSLSFKDKVLNVISQRDDEWASEVKHRVLSVSDLVAADAIYH